MSVSAELLCSFELLKPLDSSALKSHIKKGRNKRNSILNSPVSHPLQDHHSLSVARWLTFETRNSIACECDASKFLIWMDDVKIATTKASPGRTQNEEISSQSLLLGPLESSQFRHGNALSCEMLLTSHQEVVEDNCNVSDSELIRS
jgi:hypothetical protein